MALIVWIVVIFFFRGYWQKKPVERDGDVLTMICQVEEIVGVEDSASLVCKDVYEGETLIGKKMKLYQGSNKNLFSNIRIGQIIQVHALVYSFQEPGNPGQFNEFQYNQEQGIDYKAFVDQVSVINQSYHQVQHYLQQLRLHLAKKIQQCCDKKDSGILIAMILGEKSVLDEEVRQLYQENGIAHVLAISGLHISLIGATLFFLLRKYVMPMHCAAIVTIVLLIGYGILIGFPISATRAITMMLCQLGARFMGRHYDALCALALSAWIQLLLYPLSLFQTGFLLSYGTVLGIIIFVKEFEESAKQVRVLSAISASVGVQLITLPVILYFYYEIPLYSLLANLLILPLLGVILGVGISGVMVAFISQSIGRFFMGTTHYILLFYQWICTFMKWLPYHRIVLGQPEMWQIMAYYGLLCAWLVFRKKYAMKKHGLYGVLIVGIGILCFPLKNSVSGLEITNLDVGQGDCICIRIEHTTFLIDGGSSDVEEVGKYRIANFLKYHGIRKIDAIFITHSDSDHTNGLLEIIQDKHHMGFSIGKIILPRIKRKDDNYTNLEKQCVQSGIPVAYMQKGNYFAIGDARFHCLHPYSDYDWMSENDYSLVLELQYGKFRGLFTGDLEEEGEKAIVRSLTSVEYLKVGHHGSKGSSSEMFLEKISPRISVYSAGRKNRYGHPAEETKKRMKKIGAKEFCTFRDGAVTVHTDGTSTSVSTFCQGLIC